MWDRNVLNFKEKMMETFDLVIISKIKDKVRYLYQNIFKIIWIRFEERLQNEFFDENKERMSKRDFFDWIEQQLGANIGPNELLKEFEKKFGQFLLIKMRIFEMRKLKLFLQVANEILDNTLLFFFQNGAVGGGFTKDWRRLKDVVSLIIKQQWMKAKGYEARMEASIPLVTRTSSIIPSSSLKEKGLNEDTLKELMNGLKELKVEMNASKRSTKLNTSQIFGR